MKKIIIILIVLFIFPIKVYADEDTSKVVIAFDLRAVDKFTYEVRVSDGGYLYDGSQTITNGVMEYALSVGETKEFYLKANRGYEIKEIKLNNKHLTTDIEKIKIAGVSGRSILEVRYGKITQSDISFPPDTIPKIPNGEVNDMIKTGDIWQGEKAIYMLLMTLLAGYVINKKAINTLKRDDNK